MSEHRLHIKPWAGGWAVFSETGKREGTDPLRTRGDAVIHAKELAKRFGSAQILVFDEHGKLDSEFFFQPEERSALDVDDTIPSLAASRPAHRQRPAR